MPKEVFITYSHIGIMLDEHVRKIQTSGEKFKYIYGVPNGAALIALHLSHYLKLKLVSDIYPIPPAELLIVDDLTDSGKTLREVVTSKVKTATLFYKPHKLPKPSFKPDFYVEETLDWIRFPWERPNEEKNREGYE